MLHLGKRGSGTVTRVGSTPTGDRANAFGGISNVPCDACHPVSSAPLDTSNAAAGTSLVADLLPGVGTGKSAIQVLTGKDLVTGEPVNRGLEVLGIGLGLVPLGKLFTKGDDAVDLYRAVSNDELVSIRESGAFSAGENSLGGKFFAESADDARKWGDRMNGVGNSHLIKVQLPKADADQLMRWERLDAIGPARYGELEQLLRAKITEID